VASSGSAGGRSGHTLGSQATSDTAGQPQEPQRQRLRHTGSLPHVPSGDELRMQARARWPLLSLPLQAQD
jgi:hypothetical protein